MNFVYLFFFAAAWIVIQCLIGGTRLLFSIPAYSLLSVAAILSLASIRGRRIPPVASCVLATLLLGAWVLIRALRSPIQYLALPDFFMMIGCLMAYLLTAFYLTGQRDRTILIAVLWALAALEVWCGLIQFLKNQKFMLFGLMRAQNIERASGLFISPNHFAGFLEAVAIISLSMAVWSRWRIWARGLAVYVAIFCWIGVAISGSRGGYFSTVGTLVAFCIGSIYAVRIVNPQRFRITLIASLASVVLMVAAAAVLMGHSKLLTARMHTMVVKDVRIYNWEAALDNIRVSPWIGTGSGTHLIYGRLFRRPQIQADPVHAHCDYLELLAEYGIVGGLCMLIFLVAHVRNGLNACSEILRRRLLPSGIARSNTFAMNFGALCAVAGLAAHSVVDFNMHIPGNALVFAFIFGLLANPGVERTTGFVETRVLPWTRLLLPALGIWMLCAGFPLLPSEWCAEQARQALRDGKYFDSMDYANLGLGRPLIHHPPVDNFQVFGRPWLAWFGGIDGLVNRFGPNKKNPNLYFYLGEANRALATRMPLRILKRRYFLAAIPAFRDGLKVFPQDENALVRMAQCLDGVGAYDASEGVYQRCLKLDPYLAIIYTYYASHLRAEGRQTDAETASRVERELTSKQVDIEHKAENVLQ